MVRRGVAGLGGPLIEPRDACRRHCAAGRLSPDHPRRPKGHLRRRRGEGAVGGSDAALLRLGSRSPCSRSSRHRCTASSGSQAGASIVWKGLLAAVLMDPFGELLGVLPRRAFVGQRGEGVVPVLELLAQQHHHRQQGLAVDVAAGDALVDPPVRVMGGGQVQRFPGPGQVVEVAAPRCLLDRRLDPGDIRSHHRPEGLRVDGRRVDRRCGFLVGRSQESPPSSASVARRSIEALSFAGVI